MYIKVLCPSLKIINYIKIIIKIIQNHSRSCERTDAGDGS